MSRQESHESLANPAALNDFISSLQRLFKIAIYYPQGHAILDKATKRFMVLLAALAGDNPSVVLQDYRNTLILENVEIDPDYPFVQEFKDLMSTLGITAIRIDREITMAELHQFVRKMISFKSKIVTAKQFTQVEIEQLPHSVEVTLKEFLARQDASLSRDSTGDSTENISSFIDSLSSYGLNNNEINQCRELLNTLPNQLAENDIDISDLPHASWDDIAHLLANVVNADRKTEEDIRNRVTTHTHINALAAILRQLETKTQDKKSHEAINLLVSIIRRPLTEAENELDEDDDGAGRIFPDDPSMSIEEIQEFAAKNRLHPRILTGIPQTSEDDEALSILMQLAQHDQTLHTQIRMQQIFRELLSSELSEKKWEILSAGLHLIVSQGKRPHISSTIKLITDPLRKSPHSSPLHLLFLTTQMCNSEEAKLLWPYLVNEILISGSSSDPQSYQFLCQFVAKVPAADMLAALPHLEVLEAFQDNKIASDIFNAVPRNCYPFFAFLYKTEIASYIGERILGGLRREPPDWLIKAIVPLLDLSQQEHKVFLYSYLRQTAQKTIPTALKGVAAKIIVSALNELPQERRNEGWIIHTIASLAQLQTKDSLALLDQIATHKKLLFIPDWPTECRKAAETALKSKKRQR